KLMVTNELYVNSRKHGRCGPGVEVWRAAAQKNPEFLLYFEYALLEGVHCQNSELYISFVTSELGRFVMSSGVDNFFPEWEPYLGISPADPSPRSG
ncbi:MAG: hypothetical protein ACXVZX_07125, partial [Terriglobales bacterium]